MNMEILKFGFGLVLLEMYIRSGVFLASRCSMFAVRCSISAFKDGM